MRTFNHVRCLLLTAHVSQVHFCCTWLGSDCVKKSTKAWRLLKRRLTGKVERLQLIFTGKRLLQMRYAWIK